MDSVLDGILRGVVVALLVILGAYGVAGIWLEWRHRRRK